MRPNTWNIPGTFPALRHIPGTFPALREFIRIYSKVPYLFETRLKLETPIAGVVPIIPGEGGPPPINPTLRLFTVF